MAPCPHIVEPQVSVTANLIPSIPHLLPIATRLFGSMCKVSDLISKYFDLYLWSIQALKTLMKMTIVTWIVINNNILGTATTLLVTETMVPSSHR